MTLLLQKGKEGKRREGNGFAVPMSNCFLRACCVNMSLTNVMHWVWPIVLSTYIWQKIHIFLSTRSILWPRKSICRRSSRRSPRSQNTTKTSPRQDWDQASNVPRQRLWKLGLETTQDQDSSLKNRFYILRLLHSIAQSTKCNSLQNIDKNNFK